MFEFYLLLFLFPLYYSEKLIQIQDFQEVTLFIEDSLCNYTLNYTSIGSPYFKQKYILVKLTELKKVEQYLCVYKDFEQLKKDKEKNYCNKSFNFKYYYGYLAINIGNNFEDTNYYITFINIYDSYYSKETFRFDVLIFSIAKFLFFHQSVNFSGKKFTFLFAISPNNYKRMGLKNLTNDALGEVRIFDLENYQLMNYIPPTNYFEYNLKLASSNIYIINVTLTSNSQNNDINKIYFYFLDSYTKDFFNTNLKYFKYPSNYTEEFPVLKKLNLSLNISEVPAYSKVYFEYDWEYSLEDSIKVYGYSDKELIHNPTGEELYLNKDENCVNEKRRCEVFFQKKYKGLKYAILDISSLKNNYNDSYNITIKYGYSYEYSSGLPFYSTLIGIALYIPNIIFLCMDNNKFQCYHSSGVYGTLDFFSCLGFQI